MKQSNTSFGNFGETLACNHLIKKGYKIIGRNYRIRGGEIDIIALHDDTVIFVEVKTRTSKKFGLPEEAITPHKIAFLQRAINFYAVSHPNLPQAQRLDAVVIQFSGAKIIERIEHIVNISR